MQFSLFSAAAATPPEAGIEPTDLIKSVVFPIVVAILAPLALQAWAMIIKRQAGRVADRQTFAGLKNEIARVHEQNEKLRQLLETNLKNGELRRKMDEDSRYFIYIAQGSPSLQVFDTKTKSFAFLTDDCFKLLIEYYDTQSLIQACLTDMRSEIFRELNTPRKHMALENIASLLGENQATYARCQDAFQRQPKRLKTERPERI